MGNIFEQQIQRETVFLDRNRITPHHTPEKLPYREEEIDRVSSALAPALHEKKADNLFIYGKTGTGKTATTRFVLGQLESFAGQRNAKVDVVYLNCRNHNSKYRVLFKVVDELFAPKNPGEGKPNFLGYSYAFVNDKLIEHASKGNHVVLALDELDKVKDLDDLVYSLTRDNDEIQGGSVTIIGISNDLTFKDRLDPRTKSSLCQQEMVFPPYNAEELKEILRQRVKEAFKPGSVDDGALSLAAALAAQESGDARRAVLLLLRAGEVADKRGKTTVSESEVQWAKRLVEEEIIFNMISTLPEQQQLVLYAIAQLTLEKRPVRKLSGEVEEGVLYSGEVYDGYCRIAKAFKENTVSSRWYREYVSELEMYGLILTTASGKGVKGQTRFIKLGFDAKKIKDTIEKELGLRS